MEEPISGRQLANLLGEDLARRLGVTDGEYTAEEVAALTTRLEESTTLAEEAAEGNEDALTTLFCPSFMAESTGYDSFDAFVDDAPWDGRDLGALFAARDAGLESTTTRADADAYVTQGTEFTTTGEMVQAAIVHHVRGALDDRPE